MGTLPSTKRAGKLTAPGSARPSNPYVWISIFGSADTGQFQLPEDCRWCRYGSLLEEEYASHSFAVFSRSTQNRSIMNSAPLPRREDGLWCAAMPRRAAAVPCTAPDAAIYSGPPAPANHRPSPTSSRTMWRASNVCSSVCEKRAAIDVGVSSPPPAGLDEMCCLFHDSQTTKKEFILNLKQTYGHGSRSRMARKRRSNNAPRCCGR